MMRVSRALPVALALSFVLFMARGASAQAVSPADAQPFMGKWTMALEGPMGPLNLDLLLSVADGKVLGEIGGGDLPMTKVTDISRKGTDLVLKYEADAGGMVFPVTVTVTPDGAAKAKVLFDVADGQFSMPGTATRN